MAAVNLLASQSAWGTYYRRLCGRMDKSKAVTACAHKLAQLIYTLITKREEYVDQGQAHYEEKYRKRVIKNLTKRPEALRFQLILSPETV